MERLQLHTEYAVCYGNSQVSRFLLPSRPLMLQEYSDSRQSYTVHAISGHPTTHRSVNTSLNALPSFISRHFSDSGSFFSAAKWISVYPRSSRLFKIFGSRSALFKMSSNLGVFSTRVGSSGGSITFIILLMIRPVCLVPEVDILLCLSLTSTQLLVG